MMPPGMESSLQRVVRLRPDVEWTEFYRGTHPSWVARDPVSLEYFHFHQQEYTLARMLNGTRTLEQVLAQVPAGSITAERLLHLAAKLEAACLTVPSETGLSGRKYWFARTRQVRRSNLGRWLSPLAVRVKLFDPTLMLAVLSPLATLLFSRVFVLFWCVVGSLVGLGVAMRLLDNPNSLANAFSNITTARAIGLVAIYVAVKSIHEFGHALACKKWNAECHEIGVFFLVFTPCLYCNTTDSWKLSNRWRRACVALAGIYVELILAVLGGLVWLVTAPESIFHLLGANVLVICSLSTVLVNGNPLLRYDGYYALSDLCAVPNLSEQAREALRSTCTAWLTGRRLPAGRWDGNPRWLAFYGLAATLYRNFVAIVIVWVVWLLMDRIGLNLLGVLFAFLTIASLLLGVVVAVNQWIRELIMTGGIRILRLALVLAVLLLGGYASLYRAWPTTVSSRAVATLSELSPIYAEHAGVLVAFTPAGERVAEGTVIARIESTALQMQLIEARGSVAFLEQRVAQLKVRLVDDKSSAGELAGVIEELAKAREQLEILEAEARSLVHIANTRGTLLAGEPVSTQSFTELKDVKSAKPILSQANLGCRVERGALLGWLSRSENVELTAYVTERDAELLSPAMRVYCRWDSHPSQRYEGTIARIAPEPIEEIPEALRGDESIPVRMGDAGSWLPTKPHYAVKIEMDSIPPIIGHQAVGTVHFVTAPRTLLQTFRRLFDTHARPDL